MIKKIRAFTLVELMVGLIIGCIVVGCGYYSYLIVSKQFSDFRRSKNELLEISNLNNELETCFFESKEILGSSNQVKFISYKLISTSFVFNDDYVTRVHNDILDTFHLKIDNFKLVKYDGLDHPSTQFIKGLSFNVLRSNDSISFIYFKEESVNDLINTQFFPND